MGGRHGSSVERRGETPQQQVKRMDWFSKGNSVFYPLGPLLDRFTHIRSWAFHNGHVTLEDYMKRPMNSLTCRLVSLHYWAQLQVMTATNTVIYGASNPTASNLWDPRNGHLSSVNRR